MGSVVVPALLTLVAWWSATGVILVLTRLPPRSFALSLAGVSALLVVGLFGLDATADDTSVAGSALAFASALLVWAWLETSFLTGVVTGPQREPLPTGLGPFGRFHESVRAILWHELAILGLGLVVIAITAGGDNPFGLLTYLVLWVMRLSAKLNLFLGVPNVGEQYLPPHLTYLGSYFRRRRMNALFPLSVVGGGWLALEFIRRAMAATGDGELVGYVIVGTLCSLAVLEHGFMVLPLHSERLWRWSLAVRHDAAPRPREDAA